MGRWIRWRRGVVTALLGIVGIASVAQATDPRATERFRAAAALQNRELFDLAAAEYSALLDEFPAEPLADQTRVERSICLFHLERYADARDELRQLIAPERQLDPALRESCYAHLGLSEYNLGLAAQGVERDGLLDAAIVTLNQQLKQYPNGSLAARAAFYRAESLYARGQLDAAAEGYRAMLAQHPQHPQRADALYALGVAEEECGHFAEAAKTLDQFCTEFPDHKSVSDALVALAESQLGIAQAKEAQQTIDTLLARFPDCARRPRVLLSEARAHAGRSDLAAAEATLDEFLTHHAQHELAAEARLLRATVRYERREFTGSMADVDAILTADPSRQQSSALQLRGLCELGLQKPSAAIQSFERIIDTDPQYGSIDRVLYDLAWAYDQAGESARATAAFANLAEAHPESPLAAECHYRVGDAQFAAGKFAAAAARFQAAEQSATDDDVREKALHKFAWCQFEQSEYEAAQKTFDRQVAKYPNGLLAGDARIMAAECRFKRKAYREALDEFVAAVDQPSAGQSLRAMALVHAAQAAGKLYQWQRSRELSARALADFPNSEWSIEARCEHGAALYELGLLDEAERELKAVAHDDTGVLGVKAEFLVGQILLARKQFDDAVRAFFKVAYSRGGRAAPEAYHHWQAEAVYAAACALEQTNRPNEARKLYLELVDSYPASDRVALARESIDRIIRR